MTQDRILGEKIDLYHAPHLLRFPRMKYKSVITVHDLTFLLYPEHHTQANLTFQNEGVAGSLRFADQIIADSQNTKKDLIRLLGIPEERIEVVYLGIEEEYSPLREKGEDLLHLEKYGISRLYLLFLGVIEPRKNLTRLVKAFHNLKVNKKIDHKLVIAGRKGWLFKEVFDAVKEFKLEKEIVFTGYVPDEEVPSIIRGADLFVYPSLYQGFGLPPLEAMACGIPVITSNVSSLPEVVGEAGILIDPLSINEIQEAIPKLLQEEGLRKELVKKGLEKSKQLTRNRTALETLRIYQKVTGN